MFIPRSTFALQDSQAEVGSIMSKYQFAVKCQIRTCYIFPTLEVDASLPCAQLIDTPLRKTQGYYNNNTMHVGNVTLLGKPPGGFRSHTIIYPGFEVLGPFMSSYRLPIAEDYWTNRSE